MLLRVADCREVHADFQKRSILVERKRKMEGNPSENEDARERDDDDDLGR